MLRALIIIFLGLHAAQIPVAIIADTPNGVTIKLVTGAHAAAVTGTTSVTTSGVDTTGATLLICNAGSFTTGTIAVTDSNANTWHSLTKYGITGNNGFAQIWYSFDKSGGALVVGAAHTFTTTNTSTFNSINCAAFSGSDTTSAVFEATKDAGATSSGLHTTIQPGSLAAASAGDLIVTGWESGSAITSTLSIDLSFAITDTIHNAADIDGSLAYWSATTTAAVNPTWTVSPTSATASGIAVFKHQ